MKDEYLMMDIEVDEIDGEQHVSGGLAAQHGQPWLGRTSQLEYRPIFIQMD